MKAIAIFLGVLAAAITTRKITSSESSEFFAAVSDAADEASKSVSASVESVTDVAKEIAAPVVNLFGTPYDALIKSSAERYGLAPDVLYKLLYQESRFRADIITGKTRSPTGALGIAQFMPNTAVEQLGSVDAALNPDIAIPGAARYLSALIRQAGSLSGGVAAYNWGIGNYQRKGPAQAPSETRRYVLAITGETLA